MSDSNKDAESFEAAAKGRRTSLAGEILSWLKHNKKWWLAPILVILLLVTALVLLSSTAAAPFIYTLF